MNINNIPCKYNFNNCKTGTLKKIMKQQSKFKNTKLNYATFIKYSKKRKANQKKFNNTGVHLKQKREDLKKYIM